jgi:hypothetical protein
LRELSDHHLNLFPLFNRALRKQAMLERVLVVFWRARSWRASVHPTTFFVLLRTAGDWQGLPGRRHSRRIALQNGTGAGSLSANGFAARAARSRGALNSSTKTVAVSECGFESP